MSQRTTWTVPQTHRLSSDMGFWASGLIFLVLLWFLLLGGQLNLLCALVVGGGLFLVSLRDKVSAALLTLCYLNLMGDIRRLANVVTGLPTLDFFLLIGPLMAFILALPYLLRLRLSDGLSKAMLFLTALMVIEIFNPKQGGITVGFSGALFYIAPILWFWIGRQLASPSAVEKLLYRIVFPLALLASVLGLYQTYVGFFPYEQAWIDTALANNYSSLSLGATIRAFGFSISAAEYATLLEIAAAAVAAAWITRKSAWVLSFPLLVSAMFLASGRSVIVKLFLALLTVWVMRKKKRPSVATLVLLLTLFIVGLVSIGFVASRYAPSDASTLGKQSAAENALSHVSGGLAHPFDERYSTAGIHQGMFLRGIAEGFTYPIGHGLGATTGAAAKFGGAADTYSSEIDLSDMFINLGMVGGLLYVYIFVMALREAVRYTQTVPKRISLPVLAILVATLGAWLISGQYSTSALVFFLIGAIAHSKQQESIANSSRFEIYRPTLESARGRSKVAALLPTSTIGSS